MDRRKNTAGGGSITIGGETEEAALRRTAAWAAVRQSERQLRAYLTASVDVVYRMSPDWSVMHHLDGKAFIADTDEPSNGWLDKYIHPDDQAFVLEAINHAILTKSVFELEHRVLRVDGRPGWTLSRAVPLLDDDGEIVEWIGTATDVTARKQQEERQHLLLNELNHRVKNTLATVQSMAMQTLRNSQDTEQARELFGARLLALSKAHDILTRENWEGALLSRVIDEALSAHRDLANDRFEIVGPPVWLSAKQALALSIALHELCTNAVKYGALSNDAGRIRVEWTVGGLNGTRRLKMRWIELDGPPVKRPSRSGFGLRLIERGLHQDLSGVVMIDFAATGVICTIEAPLQPDQADCCITGAVEGR